MAPIAGPFPPRLCPPPTEARRRADCRTTTGQGEAPKKEWPGNPCHLWTADLVIHRWHGLPAHSRRGLVFRRQRLVAEESVVRRRARATPTKGMVRKSVASVDSRSGHPQIARIAGPFPPRPGFSPTEARRLRRASCGDGPGPRPQEGMARKSVPSVDSRSCHPQIARIAGPFPPRPGFSPTEARRLRRAPCGDGPGLRPQEGMARKSVASVDSRSCHPQMPPIAGPFPARLCSPPTEARR
jgi:hypothetical protein